MSRLILFPVFLLAATLYGCTEISTQIDKPERRIAVGQVHLDPEAARRMINSYRTANGLKPLSLNSKLTKAAERHSRDLARRDRISHKGSDGSDPWHRVKGTGYEPKLAAENVGAGQRSLAEVFRGWQDSPDHNKNLLLPDASQMGIALVTEARSRYGTFWTLVLGTPL